MPVADHQGNSAARKCEGNFLLLLSSFVSKTKSDFDCCRVGWHGASSSLDLEPSDNLRHANAHDLISSIDPLLMFSEGVVATRDVVLAADLREM